MLLNKLFPAVRIGDVLQQHALGSEKKSCAFENEASAWPRVRLELQQRVALRH